MLNLVSGNNIRNCDRINRRECLQIGSLCLGGLSLSGLLEAQAEGSNVASTVTDKSVVLLFLTGGPSQIETFDPKMTAPAEFRSITGEVMTSVPGITFGGTFPKLARLAHRKRLCTRRAGNRQLGQRRRDLFPPMPRMAF